MANIPLKTIKFPGLDDTYTVPQIDSSFTGVAGEAPDSNKVKGEIDSLKEDFNIYDDGFKSITDAYKFGQLDTSGNFVERADHTRVAMEEYYIARKNDYIILKSGFSAVRCEYDGNNTLIARSIIVAGTYQLNEGSKYRFCVYYADSRVIQIPSEVLFSIQIQTNVEREFSDVESLLIKKRTEPQITYYNDGYVSVPERAIHTTSTSAGYTYSDLVYIEQGWCITVNYRDTLAVIWVISEWKDNSTLVKGIATGNNTEGAHTCSFVADHDMYIRISSRYEKTVTIEKIDDTDKDIINNTIKRGEQNYGYLLNSFLKIGAVGDSLASGCCVSNETDSNIAHDMIDHSWLQYMARFYGFTGINFTKGGMYTRGWLDDARYDYQGWTKAQLPENKCNAYLIGLGANDMQVIINGGFTLGTTADVGTDADSFYGCYSKIISNLKTVQPKAKFFLFTLTWLYTVTPPYSTYVEDINNAIKYIAENTENCYIIDLEDDGFYYGKDVTENKRVGHYNAISYNMQAMHLAKVIGNYIHDNQDEFRQIEFIGTNYSWSE